MYTHKNGCTVENYFGTSNANGVRCCLSQQGSDKEDLRDKEEGMVSRLKLQPANHCLRYDHRINEESPAKVLTRNTSMWMISPTMSK